MEQLEILKSWLESPKRIAITTHQKPDGDAIGSSLALHHYLADKGHRSKVIVPTEYSENLKGLEGSDEIMIGPHDQDMAKWTFESADIIFCLDFNSLSRINEYGKVVRLCEGQKVMIDHHLDPDDFADLMIVDSKASSTAEMVFRLIRDLGDDDKINQKIAVALYMGLMTDTGSFRFTTTTPEVHLMAARLMETGINTHAIHEQVYDNYHESRLRFLGHCFSNCLTVLPEYNTAYLVIDKPIFKQFMVKPGDTEGVVNYALGIGKINFAALITAKDDIVKLSFRSRGSFASNEFAKEFNGGGHFYAAGGKSTLSLEDAEKHFVSLLDKYKDKLNF